MKRRKSPWFAFYVDDYSGGTRTMSLAAKGAFVDLLGYQFQNGSVPDSDRLICRILGCLPEEWTEVEEEVRSKFYGVDGTLINPRMEAERLERESYREKAAENGRKGGRPKKTQPFPNGNRTLSENETQKKASTSTSTSTSYSESPESVSKPTASHPDKSGDARALKEFAEEIYQCYPRKVGKPAALRAIQKAFKSVPPMFLLAKTNDYAHARKGEDPSLTPHPATWFNQERFNDSPETWAPKHHNGKPKVPAYKPKPQTPCTLPPDYAEIEARRRAKECGKTR